MDIALLVKVLAPCLPFLIKVGNQAVEGASKKVGEDVWNKAKAVWAKLHPKVEAKAAALEAAADVAKNPSDEDLQASLRVQLKKILETDTALAAEITQILQAETARPTGDNIQMQGQSHDQSKFNQVGKIEGESNVSL